MNEATDEQIALAQAAVDTTESLSATADAMKEMADAIDAAAKEIEEAAQSSFGEDMAAATAGWASGFSNTLNEMVWSAEFSFKQIAESFAKMLTQMVIQKILSMP